MPFGHDETWTELSEGGGTLFLFTVAPDRTRSLAEVTWRDGRIAVRSTPLGSTGEFVMSALADVDGDGVRECVLSENNGRILVVRRRHGESRRRGLSGSDCSSKDSPPRGPVPCPSSTGRIRIRTRSLPIPDNTNTLHQLQVDRSGTTVVERWKTRGRGWMGYDNSFHSAYVRDVDGDGEPEVMAVNPEREDCSELIALSPDGVVKRSWLFPGRSSSRA